MSKTRGSSRTPKKSGYSRRDFVRQAGVAGAAGAVYWVAPLVGAPVQPAVDRLAIVSAMGEALIPSAPGDPGYRELEPHGITEEVIKALSALSDESLETLNLSSMDRFGGKTFVLLSEKERAQYLTAIIDGEAFTDVSTLAKLQLTYKMVRVRVLTVYYQNFPENLVPKNNHGMPMKQDLHQISNPNSKDLVTGWDVANYPGPVTWEEEEQLRARMKGILWEE